MVTTARDNRKATIYSPLEVEKEGERVRRETLYDSGNPLVKLEGIWDHFPNACFLIVRGSA